MRSRSLLVSPRLRSNVFDVARVASSSIVAVILMFSAARLPVFFTLM